MRFPRRDAGCARAFRGVARRRAQTYGSASGTGTAGASRRASGDVCAAPGRAFRFGRCAQVGQRGHSARPNVSQLLAGSHSGPGRSPGTAPHPASRRLMNAPLSGMGWCRIRTTRKTGISSHTSSDARCRKVDCAVGPVRGSARNPGQHGGGSSCLRPDFFEPDGTGGSGLRFFAASRNSLVWQ